MLRLSLECTSLGGRLLPSWGGLDIKNCGGGCGGKEHNNIWSLWLGGSSTSDGHIPTWTWMTQRHQTTLGQSKTSEALGTLMHGAPWRYRKEVPVSETISQITWTRPNDALIGVGCGWYLLTNARKQGIHQFVSAQAVSQSFECKSLTT